jgi:hypothetical protein
MADLQADFKILPVAVTNAGAWRYAFSYDVAPRHYPELPERARWISEDQARRKLVEYYFMSVGAARLGDLTKLFRWEPTLASRAVDSLSQERLLRAGLSMEDQPGDWVALLDLI